MRISDWSSDVCSSDLRALALSVEAKDLRQLIARLGSQAELRERLASLPGPVLRPANIPEAALPPPAERMDDSAPAAPAARPGRFILPALGEVTTGFAELSQSGIRSRGISPKTRPKAQELGRESIMESVDRYS